jgi:hypothetical protein
MGTTAQSAIMVGDSNVDVGAARAAGMPVVLVSYGYSSLPLTGLGADVIIDHFRDLPKAIAALSRVICPAASEAIFKPRIGSRGGIARTDRRCRRYVGRYRGGASSRTHRRLREY